VTDGLDGRTVGAAFTGDSKHLLFLFEDAATERIDLYRVNPRGKGLRMLTADVSGSASGTMAVSPWGAEVLVPWEFGDRRDLLLVDAVRAAPGLLGPGLPDGGARFPRPGDHAWFPAPGVLHFTWRPDGATRDDLWQLDEVALVRRATEIDSAHAVAGGTVVLSGSELVYHRPDGATRWGSPAPIDLLARGFDGESPVVATAGVVLQLRATGGPVNLLPDHEFTEVEEIRAFPDGRGFLVAGQEGGRRRLYRARAGDLPLDLAKGHEGRVGAFRTITPDGLVIWARLAEDSSVGDLIVRDLRTGAEETLVARVGVLGIPGGAVVSPASGDVLFNVVSLPDADRLLFLWRRKADRIRPLTPETHRPGTYLFTR
jgi:hypothetical protein